MPVITSKVQLHIEQSLAFSGLVILEKKLMFHLRRDLWPTAHNVASDFGHWAAVETYLAGVFPRVRLFEVRFGSESTWARVAARSDEQLADRIHWVTGLDVAEVREYQAEERTAEAAPKPTVTDEIPAWPCAARTEALERRAKQENTSPVVSG